MRGMLSLPLLARLGIIRCTDAAQDGVPLSFAFVQSLLRTVSVAVVILSAPPPLSGCAALQVPSLFSHGCGRHGKLQGLGFLWTSLHHSLFFRVCCHFCSQVLEAD